MTHHLIIIEDDENFATLIRTALEGLFDSIHHVTTWEEAEKHLAEKEIAWVDLRLSVDIGEKESIDKITELRKKQPNLIIIVGSGHISPEMRARLEKAGTDGVYYKGAGFTAQQVAAEIMAAIMRASMRDKEHHRQLLDRALKWMRERFPTAQP